jgi:hypothetical protein
MFEHWRQLTYFESTHSVFPSDELLEEMELYDTAPRRQVAHALSKLVDNFQQYLQDAGIYDYFYDQQYGRVLVNNESMLFF